MKKALLIVIALVVLAVPTLAATGGVESAGVALQLSLLKYEPIPAHPGDAIDVWVKLDNTGGDVARYTKLEIQDNYPFRVENKERKLHQVGALAGSFDYVAKYKVRVSQNAPVGTAYVKARYTYGDSVEDRWTEALLPIDLESRITSLSIESVKNEPSQLSPGEEGKLIIKVKNMADSVIRRITLKLDLEDSTAPVVPTSTATEIKLDEMKPGEERDVVYNIIAELNAQANAYKIPLNVSFTEDTGDEIAYEDLVGVVIAARPELEFTVDDVDVYANEPTGRITLQFVNRGIDEIKFVYVRLLPSRTYDLLSPATEYYVGNIDSDDYEVEDISVRALQSKLEIPMEVEFRDSANKFYKRTVMIPVNLVNKEDFEDKGISFGAYFPWLLLLLVLVYLFWKRRKRRKENDI